MSKVSSQDWPVGIKLLSLLVAALLWLSVLAERIGEVTLQAQVRPEHLPAGLTVASQVPGSVEVTVSGPRILLLLLPLRELFCALDLTGAGVGTANYQPQEGSFALPDKELKVIRVVPSVLAITLAK